MPASLTPPESNPPSQAQAGLSTKQRWVQSVLAIATGYLFLALGVIAIMGILAIQGVEEFTPTLLILLALIQLCLATAGSYITALLAPSQDSSNPSQSLTQHAAGLATLVLLLWIISAFASNGQEPWSIQILNLATALIGISTGTWLRLRQTQP